MRVKLFGWRFFFEVFYRPERKFKWLPSIKYGYSGPVKVMQADTDRAQENPYAKEIEDLKVFNDQLIRTIKSLDREVQGLKRKPASKQQLIDMMPAQYWDTSTNKFMEFADSLEKFHNITGVRE